MYIPTRFHKRLMQLNKAAESATPELLQEILHDIVPPFSLTARASLEVACRMSVALTPRLVVTIFIGMVSVNNSRLMLWTYDYVNDKLELGKPKQYASMKHAELSDIEFLSWEAWRAENTPLLDKMLKIKALDPGHQGFQPLVSKTKEEAKSTLEEAAADHNKVIDVRCYDEADELDRELQQLQELQEAQLLLELGSDQLLPLPEAAAQPAAPRYAHAAAAAAAALQRMICDAADATVDPDVGSLSPDADFVSEEGRKAGRAWFKARAAVASLNARAAGPAGGPGGARGEGRGAAAQPAQPLAAAQQQLGIAQAGALQQQPYVAPAAAAAAAAQQADGPFPACPEVMRPREYQIFLEYCTEDLVIGTADADAWVAVYHADAEYEALKAAGAPAGELDAALARLKQQKRQAVDGAAVIVAEHIVVTQQLTKPKGELYQLSAVPLHSAQCALLCTAGNCALQQLPGRCCAAGEACNAALSCIECWDGGPVVLDELAWQEAGVWWRWGVFTAGFPPVPFLPANWHQ